MTHNKHENACQKSQRIYQNIQYFSDNPLFKIVRINGVDYPYNSSNNIIEINRIPYNIQQKGVCPIIVDNNRSRLDTLSPAGKLAKPAITNYLAYLAREGKVQ